MMVRSPSTPVSKIARTAATTPGGVKSREENIFVTVRVRPLSRREQSLKDQVAWDCRDENTIYLKSITDRCSGPYTFDKVFDPSSATQRVYDEGAKDVALSALTGINATIFAYGQTSSGKTFTMRGITENAVKDIFEHIRSTPERDFVLKFSALEIYNETVIDLLNRDSGPLRLLDDPEKGIIVEKQIEEVAKDSQHLRSLIGICEAQRQVGETALNDTSSRSHQIIKLTVESSLREYSGRVKSYIASLNLVDLAGSERASQTNVDGMRLKEGSHINRSLLTLTTVIRKLSVGKRGHIPYRDSKLTRILQPSLGGNSRTAIICTMSPALSHVEQSRNTLSFATRAKEVTNTAKVNMVVAEKQLVRHLQNEVARLEAELQCPEPSSLGLKSQLAKKDMEIQQMKLEMEELKRQRDRAKSELELERSLHKRQKGVNSFDNSPRVAKCLSFSTENVLNMSTPISLKGKRKAGTMRRRSITCTDPCMLAHEIRKLEQRQKQLGEEANRALEVLHKEVASHRYGSQDAAQTVAKLLAEIKEMQAVGSMTEEIEVRGGDSNTNLKEEITRLNTQGNTIATLEEKLENVQKSIDKLMMHLPTKLDEPKSQSPLRNSTNMPPHSPGLPVHPSTNMDCDQENRTPVSDRQQQQHTKTSTPAHRPSSVNVKKMQEMFKNAAEENIRSIRAYVTELKERVAKLQYQKQLLVCQVLELEENESSACETEVAEQEQSPISWHIMFTEQRKQIIMLWHLCHVSIVHRTQFFLLFRGEPDDQMYVEVELRRLVWLEQQLADVGNASPALLGDEPACSVSSSIRALKQEREQLSKRASSRLSAQELEMLYIKWDVPPGGKQRRLQLVNKLWTDPHNMQHVQESAQVVAKLVGFCEDHQRPSKEMFHLNFVLPSDKKSWMGWNLISNLLQRSSLINQKCNSTALGPPSLCSICQHKAPVSGKPPRWSLLPGRTDNDVKNHWNTEKKLAH